MTAEETLACYTSVNAARKAGRLQINLDSIHKFVNEHMAELEMANPSSQNIATDLLVAKPAPSTGPDKIHRRLKDLIMATALSIIIQEFQKRQTIRIILMIIAQAYSG